MSKYIDAEYDLHKLPFYYDFSDDELIAIRSALKGIPTADVVEVARGEWIEKGQDVYCSVCKKESAYTWYGASKFSKFCPNCGARMV